VSADSGIGNPENISDAYEWKRTTRAWRAIQVSEPLSQGAVLWLYAKVPSDLILKGKYTETALTDEAEAGSFYTAGLEEVQLSAPPEGTSLWLYEVFSQTWQKRLGGREGFLSDSLGGLKAGQALFVQSTDKIRVGNRKSGVIYYHSDHLATTNMTTDGTGSVQSETNYYPFGEIRIETQKTQPYGYIGKEKDPETGNMYFEARYYNGSLAHFLSVDSLVNDTQIEALRNPQNINTYSYAINNPVIYRDTSGFRGTSYRESLEGAVIESLKAATAAKKPVAILEALEVSVKHSAHEQRGDYAICDYAGSVEKVKNLTETGPLKIDDDISSELKQAQSEAITELGKHSLYSALQADALSQKLGVGEDRETMSIFNSLVEQEGDIEKARKIFEEGLRKQYAEKPEEVPKGEINTDD